MEKIPELKELSEELGVMANWDALVEVKDIEKTGRLREKILERAKPRDFLSLPCYEPWLWPKIEPNGEIGPCSTIFLSHFCGREVSVRSKSFDEIWRGEEFQRFRKAITEGRLPESCANCVSTHLALNSQIREGLRKWMRT
jgi:radical SAM protein with 4Fe4S-binding SPASM domain